MDTKLTLRLDERLIDRAKNYASKQRTSLSQLVANFFRSLEPPPRGGTELGGTVAELSGILPKKLNMTSLKRGYGERMARKHG